MAASPVISNKNFVTRDLLKLPNDVVIVLEDGKIEANKDLLSVRSDFFERSFNNPKFIESQSKSITMKGCTVAAMRAIVDYVYTGDMDLRDYTLATLLRIMNYSREILIEDDIFNLRLDSSRLLEDAGVVLPLSWDLLTTCPGPTSTFL